MKKLFKFDEPQAKETVGIDITKFLNHPELDRLADGVIRMMRGDVDANQLPVPDVDYAYETHKEDDEVELDVAYSALWVVSIKLEGMRELKLGELYRMKQRYALLEERLEQERLKCGCCETEWDLERVSEMTPTQKKWDNWCRKRTKNMEKAVEEWKLKPPVCTRCEKEECGCGAIKYTPMNGLVTEAYLDWAKSVKGIKHVEKENKSV